MSVSPEFGRYLVVGAISNALLFLAYVSMTRVGSEPKVTMTFLYIAGTAITFAFNRRWSFSARAQGFEGLGRYVCTYLLGYVLNYAALAVFVDLLDLPHQAVQAVVIVTIALMTFVLQKYWVFRAQ